MAGDNFEDVTSSTPIYIIKNGTVVNADSTIVADVLIKDGKIVEIAPNMKPIKGARVIEALGLYIMPGGIDPHTHFDFEFMGTKTIDDFYSGTRAAVQGGTTMIIDFIIPRNGESLFSAYDRYVEKAESKAVCDYAFHMAITYWNENIPSEMNKLVVEKGINSFKMFMAYKNMLMLNDDELYKAFLACKNIGALPMVHAENGSIIEENAKILLANGVTGPEGHSLSRPEVVEMEATNRACVIASQVQSPLYVVHVMTDRAAQVIADYRKEGKVNVFGETLSSALACTNVPDDSSFRVSSQFLMSPPISHDPSNQTKLMKRLAKGELTLTGSDNCTFSCEQKESLGKTCFTKIPNGCNGVEDRLSVIWQNGVNSKLLTVNEFVAVTSTNAAKLFNVYPRKGAIAVGSDADIVVWDPYSSREISSKTHKQAIDFNIFEGMKITGTPKYVFVNGVLCVENDQLNVVKGFGKYVPTPSFNSMLYKK